jgi:phosphate transport system substrate-binding protein
VKKLLISSILFLSIAGCSVKPLEVSVITIKGSDSMLLLTENLAEEYMRQNPGISIYVYGGGTASGITALIKGEIDICAASRNLRPEEAKALAEYYSTVGLYYLIAKDALSIYLNPLNPVNDIKLSDLKKIFECKITNWSELSGKNQKMIPVIRNINSGTHLYFKDHVLEGNEYCDRAVVKATTPEIIEYVEQNENAIGYGSMGYKGNIVYAKINGIEPSDKNAQNDTYPLTRYLHFFIAQTPKGAVKKFTDWVLSPEGQRVVKQAGYIPLWDLNSQLNK